jgi:acyl carrier protein
MANYLTQEAIASQVEEIVREHVGADEALTPEIHLQDDLAIDSLERVELGIKLEKTFGVALANEKIRSVVTLGDFIQLVARQANLQKEVENRI